MSLVRSPAVAGAFYPADAVSLSGQIRAFLAEAGEEVGVAPKALIAPHAGYIYSGPVAAHAYAHLQPLHDVITRVVLLGPCHRVPTLGLALSSAETFLTPLGPVAIDHSLDQTLLDLPQVHVYDATHTAEHSLEVHIPFLQVVLDDFKLVPMVVGQASPAEVAEVLDRVWGGPETLIVVSSDLSHYLSYDAACAIDRKTCDAIEHLDVDAIGDAQACGRMPVKGLLHLAKRKGMCVRTLDLRNSGDTAGPRTQVVGYGSWGFWEDTSQ
ncbi:AmmeMemoRadiSam system protein B [Magnetovibrio sp.]|uniref:AmmeMemoRadiSam system protein B n=1 Tax=Magnetovibrio sp. TaxID=2024836 RepID=UPI002F9320C3